MVVQEKGKEYVENGMTYLYELQRPSLDIPFSLRDAPHVVVDEESFCCDTEDQAIGHGTHSGNQLRDGDFGEGVVEGVDCFDDDFVGIFAFIWTTMGRRGRGACGRVGRCVG